MDDINTTKPPTWFWVVAIIAVIWEIFGVASYLYHVTLSPAGLAALPESQRRLMEITPTWVNGAFAIATWSGLAGAVGLVLRRRWAQPLLLVSVVAIVIQFGWVFLVGNSIELIGPGSVAFPMFILGFGIFLWWFAGNSARRGWLR